MRNTLEWIYEATGALRDQRIAEIAKEHDDTRKQLRDLEQKYAKLRRGCLHLAMLGDVALSEDV